MGTASYMAPEQVRGETADPRTDIFAFGAVLYEMLSGVRAFRRDTAAETMTAVLKDDPPELSDPGHLVSSALERIVRRCLEKNPEQRFQSARDLSFALSALSGTESSTLARAAAARHRTPLLPWLAAALALVAVAVADLVCGAASSAHHAHAVRPRRPRRNEHQPHGAVARRFHAGVCLAGRKLGHAHALRAARRLLQRHAAARHPGSKLSLPVTRRQLRRIFRQWQIAENGRSPAVHRRCWPLRWLGAAAVGAARV